MIGHNHILSVTALALLTSFLPTALGTSCSAGTYSSTGSGSCANCPQGTYSSGSGAKSCTQCPTGYYQDQTGSTSCKAAQAGWHASGPGATCQEICPTGYYSSSSGSGSCTICPAGTYCNGQGRTSPQSCEPGRYSAQAGATQDCPNCPMGTFNNVYGATSCCTCCSGWYTDQTGQTHCFNCPNKGTFQQGYSSPGATSSSQCSAQAGALSSCSQDTSTGACPATTTTTTTPSAAAHRRSLRPGLCARGQRSCPTYEPGALSGYECVNTQRSLEQCGGCVPVGESLGGVRSSDGGRDCSAIPQVEEVSCYRGSCHIKRCKAGYVVSADGERCEAGPVLVQQPRDRAHSRRSYTAH